MFLFDTRETLIVTITPGQSVPGSNGNARMTLHSLDIWN